MGQYLNELYSRNQSLECENKALRDQIAAYKSGKRYIKIQEDNRRVQAGYQQEIKRLNKELEAAHMEKKKVRDIWFAQCDFDWEHYQAELEKRDKKYRELEDKYWEMVREYDNKILSITEDYENQLNEAWGDNKKKEAIIRELETKLAYTEAKLNRDGTNTGTPTSKTPGEKGKRIPNTRQKSGKPKGGQEGHEQHTLEPPEEEEINDEETYEVEGEVCPSCGSEEFAYTGEWEDHYEYDYKVEIIKKRHRYYLYECLGCGEIVKSGKGPDFRSECQYGPVTQAIALSLMNTTNAAMNKTALFLAGLSGGEISPCEGYISKLQPRAAKGLDQFYAEMRERMIMERLIYWDDTVAPINTKRGCLRFYGNENIAFYTAHMKKDLKGLLEDNILQRLPSETYVMHDHNTVNYNPAFHFKNLECDQHGERDCQKNTDNTGHNWSSDMKDLIASTIHDRNILEKEGMKRFGADYVETFNQKFNQIIENGLKEYEADKKRLEKYGGQFEHALLIRFPKYRENYFAWLEDFSLPTTNNLSERSLRMVKSKMKIAGQFESEEAAQNYAVIRTYIETCRRRGKNEIEALIRLCKGKPYTVDELFP